MLTLSKFLENPRAAIFGDAPDPETFKAQIAALTEQNTKLTADVAALTVRAEKAEADSAAHKATAEKAVADIATAQASFEAEKKALIEQHKTAVSQAVLTVVASAGHEPVVSEPKGAKEETLTGKKLVLSRFKAEVAKAQTR